MAVTLSRSSLLFTPGNSFPSIITYNQQSSQQSSYSPEISAKMAILPGVPFIRVTVNAPKISAEYPDLDDNEDDNTQNGPQHKMSVYVESKTGAKFGLQYLVDPAKIPKFKKKKNYCLGFFAIVDGKKTSSTVICNENGFKPDNWEHTLTGDRLRQPGNTELRPFQFSELQIGRPIFNSILKIADVDSVGDDAPFSHNQKEVSQLGELIVQVWRVRKVVPVATPISAPEQETMPINTKFHEKELKGRALTHATELGKPQKISDQETFYRLEYLDLVNKPLAEFHFKYRSREVLQQMMDQGSTPKVSRAPLPSKPLPGVLVQPALTESTTKRPCVLDKNADKGIQASTAHKHKAIFEVATPPPPATKSVITGRSFDPVTGAFLSMPVLPPLSVISSRSLDQSTSNFSTSALSSSATPTQKYGQMIPKVTTSSAFASSPKVLPGTPTVSRGEIRYPSVPAFGSISQVAAPSFVLKARPAMPVETPTEAMFKPNAVALTSGEMLDKNTDNQGGQSVDSQNNSQEPPALPVTPATPKPIGQVALEPSATPFTRVLMEIQRNLGQLRDIAKGFNVVNVVEVQEEISRVVDKVQAEVEGQAGPEVNLKREHVNERDEDEPEVILERPVKRRHIFTAEDEIIDLTAD
ncbi:uncharacterized protein EAE97_006958 [Botrytis byssoidea]|uniref:DUF7918 domain-containing protein n=1 Tax=Botrytis byssoidea TaxID=139641 RepID=A0A9P5IN29_9HELO|nr:uncharacterized protein EAE97_006958 [Botrytis byssoidea]KAF7940772.1 hypothetical protein EAE97_006958 [Botrytis byssoidea]